MSTPEVVKLKNPVTEADNRSLVLFGSGDEVVVQPILMNTQEQLQQAFAELQEGTF